MHPGHTEDVAEQLAGTVHDRRLTGEVRIAGHEADDLHHLLDPVDVLHDGQHGGYGVEGADSSTLHRQRFAHPGADLPVAISSPFTIGTDLSVDVATGPLRERRAAVRTPDDKRVDQTLTHTSLSPRCLRLDRASDTRRRLAFDQTTDSPRLPSVRSAVA
jgi:hypothetical protein